MDFDDPHQRAVFFDIHHGLPREGPGNRACGAQALDLVGSLPSAARVLDVGCGPGLQTVELAEMLPGARIVAVDNHPPFLDELDRRAAEHGVSDRVETRNGDMAALDFPTEGFDLIWCEAAAYVIGFGEALEAWRPLLAPAGKMAVSEVVWLRDDPPSTVRQFWESEYPAIRNVAACRALAREAGYEVFGDFIFPEEAWWENYYAPIETRLADLRSRYARDAVAQSVLEENRDEIELYRRYKEYYGYCFFVLARSG